MFKKLELVDAFALGLFDSEGSISQVETLAAIGQSTGPVQVLGA